jgi:hypothetical protein
MTRIQRLRHARTFYVLCPLLIGLFAYAISTRSSAAAHLREHARTAPALQVSTQEKAP